MITPGCIERWHPGRGIRLSGLVRLPLSPARGWLVSVHGISRRARQHAELMTPVAEALGLALAAPRFDARHFPDYQRLGYLGPGGAADVALLRWLDSLEAATGVSCDRIVLIGFSGGAQFAHRFALRHPRRVLGYVSAAAGWYTWPKSRLPYPHGTGGEAGGRLRDWLSVPCRVLVGERDDRVDAATRQSPRLSRRQGATRLQRALSWSAAMNRAAERRGLPAPCTIRVLPHADHSFRRCMTAGGMGEQVAEAAQPWLETLQPSVARGPAPG